MKADLFGPHSEPLVLAASEHASSAIPEVRHLAIAILFRAATAGSVSKEPRERLVHAVEEWASTDTLNALPLMMLVALRDGSFTAADEMLLAQASQRRTYEVGFPNSYRAVRKIWEQSGDHAAASIAFSTVAAFRPSEVLRLEERAKVSAGNDENAKHLQALAAKLANSKQLIDMFGAVRLRRAADRLGALAPTEDDPFLRARKLLNAAPTLAFQSWPMPELNREVLDAMAADEIGLFESFGGEE